MKTETKITRLIKIEPDTLLEIAQRFKSQAMDFCYPGQAILTPLNEEITLMYEPSEEYIKPVYRRGTVAISAQVLDA